MKYYTGIALSLLLVLTASQLQSTTFVIQAEPSVCIGKFEYPTPSGCWTSCADPQFGSCPDVFIQIYNPSFCAYTRDGQYVSYTFACQACQNTNILAVRNGACSCDFLKCQAGQQCVNGQCVNTQPVVKPCTKLCVQGYTCVNDQCVPSSPVDEDRCQTIKCRQGYYCKQGNCIPQPGLCGVVVCAQGFVCRDGQCVDPTIDWACAAMRCDSSQGYYCRNGQCIRDCNATKVPCTGVRPTDKTCPVLYYLVKPQDTVCGVTARGEFFGYPRQCDACKNNQVLYYWNKKCEELAGCERPEFICNGDSQCKDGLSCENGRCVNKCLYVKCYPGTRCFRGACIPDRVIPEEVARNCAAVTCPVGSQCVNGRCV